MPQQHDKHKKPPGPVVEPPTKGGSNTALRQTEGFAAQEALLKPKDAAKAASDPSLRGELGLLIIEAMATGLNAKEAAKQIPAEHQAAAQEVLATIMASEFLIRSAIRSGAQMTNNGNTELVKPAPAHAIAGWIGLLPKDPRYSPVAR